MNLEINTTPNILSISLKFKDRITALLNPVLSQNTPNRQFKTVASGTQNDNCGDESAIYRCQRCGGTYPVNHHCDRLVCPICHSSASARIGKRGSSTLRSVNEAFIDYLTPDAARDVYGRELNDANIFAEYCPEAAKLANIARSSGLRHSIVSPPKKLWPDWEGYSNTQMTNAFANHVEKYLPRNIGGIFIYHPHRIRPEIRKKLVHYAVKQQTHRAKQITESPEDHEMDIIQTKGFWDAIHRNVLNLPSQEDYVYFAPHYHVIHWGTMPNTTVYHARTKGWVYKITDHAKPIPLKIKIVDGKPLDDQLRAKITYLASHAGLFQTETGRTCDIVHYFGIASPKSRQLCKTEEGRKIVKRTYQSYIDCDECGPGNHLTLCDRNETPILGSDGEIFAKDKLVVYESKLTPLGKQKVEKLLNLNWPVSRIQMDDEGIIQVPDPPPRRQNTHEPIKNRKSQTEKQKSQQQKLC